MKDLDPSIEVLIRRCLEVDPRRRPPSVLALAVSLPGGDPLAAALAAGDTPSPELVAAAGDAEVIGVKTAAVTFGIVLAGLVVVAVLGSKANFLQQTPFDQAPVVLEQKARELIQTFGHTDAPVDRAFGFNYDAEFQQFGEEQKDPNVYRALLAKGLPTVIPFWYRQSPRYLEDPNESNIISQANPPPILSGMVSVGLNPQGRLIEFEAVPPQVEKASGTQSGTSEPLTSTPNWRALLKRGRFGRYPLRARGA